MIGLSAAARLGAWLAAAVLLSEAAAGAQAAEVKVLGFLSMRPILDDLTSEFERATGDRLTVNYDSVASMRSRISAGEIADVVITSRSAVDDLAGHDLVTAGSIRDVAHVS